jgi:hypothetical protein
MAYKFPDEWNRKLNSKLGIYLSGIAFGFIIASWYRKQTGPIDWFAIVTGVVLIVSTSLALHREENGKK